MRKKFIRMTSGWIPVSFIALFAAALIAAQARPNLPEETVAAQVPPANNSLGAALNAEMLRKLESLPAGVDALLIGSEKVGRRFDARILRKELSSDQTIRRIRQ